MPYGELLSDVRTPLADFSRIQLKLLECNLGRADGFLDVLRTVGSGKECCFELRGGKIDALFQHVVKKLAVPFCVRLFCRAPVHHRAWG